MATSYPVQVTARLDAPSRWLWLVKWLLSIPHWLVLVVLWAAFLVLSVVAFVAIAVTGRYPRGIFDFNVGVLRWQWRVSFYAYSALGTDRYPPFTLRDVPDYPAHLDVEYPERLSRGLVWVKWWLLAIPHYLVVALLVGGGTWAATEARDSAGYPGLIPLLVLFAGVALLATGSYPRGLFDLVMGLNRWALRVAGYAGLMTDRYPPFRLDQGEDEPVGGRAAAMAVPATERAPGQPVEGRAPRGWTSGRIVSVVVGAVLALGALALAVPGFALLAADHVGRDDAGFLNSPDVSLSTDTAAVVSEDLSLHTDAPPELTPDAVVGDVRITATGLGGEDLFVGIGRTDDVRAYLDGVSQARLTGVDEDGARYRVTGGDEAVSPPTELDIWTVASSGQGEQVVTWAPADGDWTAVVMNADGSGGVEAVVSAGAEMPALGWFVAGLLGLAAVLLLAAAVLLTIPLVALEQEHRRSRPDGPDPAPRAGGEGAEDPATKEER